MKTKPSTAKLLFFLIFPPLVFLVLFFLFVLGGYTDIKRSIYCGPSESITKPMAEAIVREINKRGKPYELLNLSTFNNLPYEILECKKESISTRPIKPIGLNISFKQTCFFKKDKDKYSILFEYKGSNYHDNKLNMTINGDIYIHMKKSNLKPIDLTELMYHASHYNPEHKNPDKWILIQNPQRNYSEKNKGLCRYKSPIHL